MYDVEEDESERTMNEHSNDDDEISDLANSKVFACDPKT